MVKLDLSNRGLTKVPPIPNDVTELYLSNNQIVELKEGVFPSSLKKLYLSNNQIIELKEGVFPSELQELGLYYNQIVELKEGVFPSGLRVLDMSNNQIVELKKGVFPSGLQILNLSYNQIVELKEGVFPSGLQVLGLSNNQIIELKEGIFPSGLQEMYLQNNQIIELKEGVFPSGLQVLSLSNNQIVELPIHLLNLRRLILIYYRGNPIERYSLSVQRWLDRLNQGLTINNQVYSDTQNIHNSNIQKSFRQSLENIMKDKLSLTLDECKNTLLTSNLCEEVKREILNYCDDKMEHSIYLITFEDLFHYVMNRILKHDEKEEILRILEDEIKDTICKCFTGRLTRLLNVLNGFYPDVKIQIGNNEQISNVILILKEKYEGNELKEKVKEELKERGYDEEVIEEWVGFIE